MTVYLTNQEETPTAATPHKSVTGQISRPISWMSTAAVVDSLLGLTDSGFSQSKGRVLPAHGMGIKRTELLLLNVLSHNVH